MSQFLAALTKATVTLERCWTWWVSELYSLVPQAVSTRLFPPKPFVVIDFHEDDVSIGMVKKGRYTLKERLAYGARPRKTHYWRKNSKLHVGIPRDEVLTQQQKFPAASKSQIRDVVGLQLDRFSPVKIDQVCFDCDVALENDTDIHIDVAIARRDPVNRLLGVIGQWGAAPTKVGVSDLHHKDFVRFNFLPPPRSDRVGSVFQVNALLAVALVTSLWFSWGLIQQHWDHNVDGWHQTLEIARTDAEAAALARNKLVEIKTERQRLVGLKTAPSVLTVLNELSRIFPDTAWIAEFEMGENRVRVIGFADNAALLPELLERSPYFEDASFKSPITRNEREKNERFELTATIVARDLS